MIEEIKQLVEFRQCTNTTLREKCNFRVFPFYEVVQKHKLIDVTYQSVLIAYFISNVSAKNIKIRSHVSEL